MSGDEAHKALAQLLARGRDHRRLGAAHIGDHGRAFHHQRHVVQHRADRAHRNGHDDELRAARGLAHRGGGGVDDAERGGALERRRVAVVADDGRDGAALQREGERSADEPHADDGERPDAPHAL